MTNSYLNPDVRVALARISDYAGTCWTVYDQYTKGKLPLEAALSRIRDLHYEAHSCFSMLHHIRPPSKEARRDLWTCGLIHQRIRDLERAHFMQTRRDRPPKRKSIKT